MRHILPTWWKTAILAASLLLLVALIFRAGQIAPKQQALAETSQRASSFSPIASAPNQGAFSADPPAQPGPSEPNPTAANPPPPSLASASLEERRHMLNQRREFVQELLGQPPASLVDRLHSLWGSADQPGRGEEKSAVIDALINVLRGDDKQSKDVAFQQMGAWLRDPSLSTSIRSDVALILGAIQTPQSLQLLLSEYQQANDAQVRDVLARAISKTGDDRWAARFHEDLSPILQTAWPAAKVDPTLAPAVALGLAKVGAPSGVALLVGEVAGSASTVEGLSDLKDPTAQAAASALPMVRNPNAVPDLAVGLLSPNASAVQQYVCGSTLAAMGNADATRTLLKWASTASDAEAPWAASWFDQLRDTASFRLVEAATSATSNFSFSSAAVRNAVALGLRNR